MNPDIIPNTPPEPDTVSPLREKQLLLRRFLSRKLEAVRRSIKHFSIFEKAVFYTLSIIMAISAGILLLRLNDIFVVEMPIKGGSLHEGVIGSARFINPVIAISDSDRDLTALVYSGLTRALPDGSIAPDLAEKYELSEDGKTYTFTLREGARFHDNEPVTAEDVQFTIEKIQDGAIKSPKRANWVGVTTEVINEREIRFHLRQPYAPFIYNTTVGILPKHLWSEVAAEEFPFSLFNSEPIGSGPFKVSSIKHTAGGLPQTYILEPFHFFTLGEPYISEFSISFFPNEDALLEAYSKGDIDAVNSIGIEKLETLTQSDKQIVTAVLPRIFAVFFNQNQAAVFLEASVREALNVAVDKESLVKEVLGGFGAVADGPLPPAISKGGEPSAGNPLSAEERISEAKTILERAGWKYNETEKVLEKETRKGKQTERKILAFSISTANAPELKKTAGILKETWEKLGVKVDVKVFESGDLNQNVIRPRKYDALLFGEIIGRDLDLYAFWHSSQRNDPGLNIAMYANSKTDKLLEDARVLKTQDERLEKYEAFATELVKDKPAVFLYSPQFIYLLPKKVKGINLKNITVSSERLTESYRWYIETEKVWKIFSKS